MEQPKKRKPPGPDLDMQPEVAMEHILDVLACVAGSGYRGKVISWLESLRLGNGTLHSVTEGRRREMMAKADRSEVES